MEHAYVLVDTCAAAATVYTIHVVTKQIMKGRCHSCTRVYTCTGDIPVSRSFRHVVASLFHCLVITYRLETIRCHVHKIRDARLILRGMPNWKC